MAQSIKQQFVKWVGKQPRDDVYPFMDTRGCALYQFLDEAGYSPKCVGVNVWFDKNHKEHSIDLTYEQLGGRPWTFGALADRLVTSA